MAKALTGYLGAPSTSQLITEAARLRRRVAELQTLVAQLSDENERLTALHTADLDTALVGELSNA